MPAPGVHTQSRFAPARRHLLAAVGSALAQLTGTAEASLRAYAALLFGRDTVPALLVLGASLFDLLAGFAGLVAVTAATACAQLSGVRGEPLRSGYFGFSALLCGLALGHAQRMDQALLIHAAAAGVVAALLTLALSESMQRLFQLPPLALPFVITIGVFAPAQGMFPSTEHSMRWVLPDLPIALPGAAVAVLRAFSAIILQDSTAAGLLVFVALLVTSRIAASFALLGIAVASLLGSLASPDYYLLHIQAARYNSLLVCVAVGSVFFLPSWASVAWATSGALLSTWICLALGPVAERFGWPLLAWPFVVVTLFLLRAMSLVRPTFVPRRALIADATAERNLAFARMLAARFGSQPTPRVLLPVRGTWTVTQGFDGPHTHRGAWRHGLDFEILDPDGFPFEDQGLRCEDYFCFDAPVHSVLPGTVVFAYHDHPDNAPGQQNLDYPYGNVIVIQHGPQLFSVVAHLRRGSVTVATGQVVAAGTLIGRCGASGRSPRPHLHLQLQASPEIGAPTMGFQLAHYARATESTAEYHAFGLPEEGERIAGSIPLELPRLALFEAGVGFAISGKPCGKRQVLACVSPLAEPYLCDPAFGDRLYYSCLDGVVTMTTYVGTRQSPLRVLALALPRVPPFAGEVVAHEQVPLDWMIPGSWAWLCDLCRWLGVPVQVRARVCVSRTDAELQSRSEVRLHWLGRVWRTYDAEVRISRDRIESLHLSRAGRTLFAAASADATVVPPQRIRAMKARFQPAIAFLILPLIVGVAASCLLLAPKPSSARAVGDPLADSYRYEASNDLARALQAMAQAVSVSSHDYFPVLRLAHLEFLAKRYSAAALHYAEAARLAPEALEPLLGELKSWLAAENFARGLAVADRILQVDTNNYTALSSRAWCLYRLGRYRDALDTYTKVLQMYPGDIEMRLGRAYSLAGAKRPVEARMEFREVLKRVPGERRARAALGLP